MKPVVLVVDDEPLQRGILQTILRKLLSSLLIVER